MIIRARVLEWHKRFSERWGKDEVDVRPGGPVIARTKENSENNQIVQKDRGRRQTQHSVSKTNFAFGVRHDKSLFKNGPE